MIALECALEIRRLKEKYGDNPPMVVNFMIVNLQQIARRELDRLSPTTDEEVKKLMSEWRPGILKGGE